MDTLKYNLADDDEEADNFSGDDAGTGFSDDWEDDSAVESNEDEFEDDDGFDEDLEDDEEDDDSQSTDITDDEFTRENLGWESDK